MQNKKAYILQNDMARYSSRRAMPIFQKFLRKAQTTPPILRLGYKILYKVASIFYHIEIPVSTIIGEGLYVGHPYNITINPKAVIGKNVNIHRGVLIGQENRGKRKGTPVIGDSVWIGINAVIVGNVKIGDDVLIAPNSYVNCDIPSHSVVFGNPCVIKHKENATEGYVNRKINDHE